MMVIRTQARCKGFAPTSHGIAAKFTSSQTGHDHPAVPLLQIDEQFGNAAVLPISWMYMRMIGAEELQTATKTAILSANYIAARLADHYEARFSGNIAGIKGGGVAHECILD